MKSKLVDILAALAISVVIVLAAVGIYNHVSSVFVKARAVTYVICSGLGPGTSAIKVVGFRLSASGFSGLDPDGERQYYIKDANQTCYTVSEKQYEKAKAR